MAGHSQHAIAPRSNMSAHVRKLKSRMNRSSTVSPTQVKCESQIILSTAPQAPHNIARSELRDDFTNNNPSLHSPSSASKTIWQMFEEVILKCNSELELRRQGRSHLIVLLTVSQNSGPNSLQAGCYQLKAEASITWNKPLLDTLQQIRWWAQTKTTRCSGGSEALITLI